jgi:hypothetical protein
MWEDEYDPDNSKFPCKVDRTSGPLVPSQQLNLINHNLNFNLMPIGRGIRIPDRLDSPRTNSIFSYVFLFFKLRGILICFRITAHAHQCAPLVNDQLPNFVLVDFVNVGHAVEAVARLNGFRY